MQFGLERYKIVKMPGEKLFSIIIPNFNGKDLLEKNLPSVINAFRNEKNRIVEVIIVDDTSSDESVKFVKSEYPEIKIVKQRINRGFSSTVNLGARSSKGKFLVLINNDVYVSRDFLESVYPLFNENEVFGVSLHEKSYGWAKGIFKDGFIVYEGKKPNKNIHDTFWVSGGSGVFRRSMWMKLNGMDEKLLSPFYWEDIDLCYRAQKRGWKLLWQPKAKVIHHHETSISKISRNVRRKIQERNQLIFIWKNLTSVNLFRKHITGLVTRITKHPGYLVIFLMAVIRWGSIRKARLREKRESKVSDEAIFARFK